MDINEKFKIKLTLKDSLISALYDSINRVELKNFHDRLLENSIGKIYVLHGHDTFYYVGNTIEPLNSEIKQVFEFDDKVKAKWKPYNEIFLSVYCAGTRDTPILDCIAAELICLIKRITEKWPVCQNEMVFNNISPNAKFSAQQIFKDIYTLKMMSVLEKGFNTWGLRGDPFLWEELVDKLKTKPVPENIFLFYELITNEITELLGEPLEKGKEILVKRYENRGTSSGLVSSNFWIYVAIPNLLKLFAQKNLIY